MAANRYRLTGSFCRRLTARPSAKQFMCDKQRAYFLRKLKTWKEAIIEESRATMAQLQVD